MCRIAVLSARWSCLASAQIAALRQHSAFAAGRLREGRSAAKYAYALEPCCPACLANPGL